MTTKGKFCKTCGTHNTLEGRMCRHCGHSEFAEFSVTQMGCALRGCPNDGIWEYEGWIDRYGVLHEDGRVQPVLCDTHFQKKKAKGILPFGEWEIMEGMQSTTGFDNWFDRTFPSTKRL